MGDKAVGLDDLVVKFRNQVSAQDPTYYTQHYIKSCTNGHISVINRLDDHDR